MDKNREESIIHFQYKQIIKCTKMIYNCLLFYSVYFLKLKNLRDVIYELLVNYIIVMQGRPTSAKAHLSCWHGRQMDERRIETKSWFDFIRGFEKIYS